MADHPHIYTLTGNLLAERTLEFRSWTLGRTQRALREHFHTRGKGVNVSNMLVRLEVPTTALIFAGGPSGAESEAWLRQRGIPFQTFPTQAASRTGTIIWSDDQPETTFLGPDVVPDAEAVLACARFLDAQPAGQVLALGGSFPGWETPAFDPLRAALTRWISRGHLAVDAYGPPLAWLASQPLDFIKINDAEFGAFSATGPLPDRLRAVRDRSPVQRWIITQGPESIWLIDAEGEPQELSPPRLAEVSPTGSGDVFFACLLHAYYGLRRPLAAAAAYAIPFAAANAAHPGVAEFAMPEDG